MPKRYLYPGTDTLKNRFGVKDAAAANELEAASFAESRKKPVPNFTADMAGLRATHKVMFEQMYEWAGKTRDERVTIEGETFKPDDHILTKGETQFGPASLSEKGLPEELARGRATLDELHNRGTLTKEKWAEVTADQVGAINHAHPFREGNGRAMRRFIEASAEQYGYRARMIGGPEWMKASHDAMDHRQTRGLQDFIEANTTREEGEQRRPKGEAANTSKEADMAEANTNTTSTRLRRASELTGAASKAVSQIKDPERRAEAQRLLDTMRKNEANLQKAQRQGKDADRSTTKPELKQPVVRRDRGQDFER